MRDYTGYYERVNDKILNSANLMFQKQLLTPEARDVIVGDTTEKCILRNHTNEMKEGQEDRILYTGLDTSIKLGSKLTIEEVPKKPKKFIVVTDMDYHYSYYKTEIRKIDHVLKFWTPYGKLVEEECLFNGETLWNTGVHNTAQSPFPTGSAKSNAIFQYNNDTKYLNKDIRFIANRTCYKVTALNIEEEGLITVVCEETQIKEGLDDMEKEIPHNPYTPVVITTSSSKVTLTINESKKIDSKILRGNNEIIGTILYDSSDTSIATIDEDGYVTAINEGDVLITLTLKENKDIKQIVKCNIAEIKEPVITYDIFSNNGFEIKNTTTITFTPKTFTDGVEMNEDWIFDIDYLMMNKSSIEVKSCTNRYIKIKGLQDKGKFILRASNISGDKIIEKEIILKGMFE